jgi:large subunit ribosomal protein L25
MMAVTLNARTRTGEKKGGARRLRSEGLVPAVLYGRGEASQPLAIQSRELEKLLGTISVENTVIELTVEGQTPTSTLIREVQRHPMRPGIVHVDFLLIHASEKVTLDVPIRLNGNAIGVRDEAGTMEQVLYQLRVECLPGDIPEAVDVNVENLRAGETIHVSDITMPGVKILNDPELVVAGVSLPTTEAPEGAAGEGETSAAEPELVRDRQAEAE